MQPTVKQFLESIHKTVVEHIVPNVAGDAFVAEQAHLIAASLAMLVEVQPYEDDFLRAELADIRRSLAIIGRPEADVEVGDRDRLLAEVHRLKQRQHACLGSLAAANDGTLPPALARSMAPLLDRQSAREVSWTRRTGFHPMVSTLPAIQDVLASQRSDA